MLRNSLRANVKAAVGGDEKRIQQLIAELENDTFQVRQKATKELEDAHRAQLHNYMKGTGLRVGYLVNFGHYPKLEYERIVR